MAETILLMCNWPYKFLYTIDISCWVVVIRQRNFCWLGEHVFWHDLLQCRIMEDLLKTIKLFMTHFELVNFFAQGLICLCMSPAFEQNPIVWGWLCSKKAIGSDDIYSDLVSDRLHVACVLTSVVLLLNEPCRDRTPGQQQLCVL